MYYYVTGWWLLKFFLKNYEEDNIDLEEKEEEEEEDNLHFKKNAPANQDIGWRKPRRLLLTSFDSIVLGKKSQQYLIREHQKSDTHCKILKKDGLTWKGLISRVWEI